MRILFFIALLIVGTAFSGIEEEKKKYPKDYFRSPVNRNIQLAGTFGELRPNHFHAGIDIKGKVGETIYAVAEGYVARIKIQSGGYGKVLYIKHPNGYTSVYAHLQKMTKELEAYVKQFQYKRESFEVELFPSPGQFAFAKGEPIAKMGVSGRSYGPHLHFEIRDTETEKPINPLLFGLKVADNVPPKLHQLKAYFLNDRRETLHSQTFKLIKTRQGYRIKGDTLELGAWRTGFGLKVYDHMTGVSNWNGIYSLQMFQDSVEVYSFEMETFAFSESRYINAHLDYEEQVSKKSYFNRCYRLPGNRLTIYPERIDGGVIQLHQNKSSEIRLLAKDLAGNSAELRFWVKRSEVKAPREKLFTYFLPYNEENLIENPSLYLYFPKGSFYENVYLRYQSSNEKSSGVYSPVHHIQQYTTPVHKYFKIGIQPNSLPKDLRDKAFVAYCQKDGTMVNCGGTWKDGKLHTRSRDLGDYCIMTDTQAPTIQPIRFKSDMRGYNRMSFKIRDNLKTARHIDYLQYRATIDGQWILLEYDAKKDLLTHYFDERTKAGEHRLKLVVTDHCGNETIFERTFKR